MTDFSLNEEDAIINENVYNLFQQIDIYLSTGINTILGSSSYGTTYDEFLYDTTITNSAISDKIKKDITMNCELFGFVVDVDTKIYEGTQNDIILVEISIKGDTAAYKKTYRIE